MPPMHKSWLVGLSIGTSPICLMMVKLLPRSIKDVGSVLPKITSSRGSFF